MISKIFQQLFKCLSFVFNFKLEWCQAVNNLIAKQQQDVGPLSKHLSKLIKKKHNIQELLMLWQTSNFRVKSLVFHDIKKPIKQSYGK